MGLVVQIHCKTPLKLCNWSCCFFSRRPTHLIWFLRITIWIIHSTFCFFSFKFQFNFLINTFDFWLLILEIIWDWIYLEFVAEFFYCLLVSLIWSCLIFWWSQNLISFLVLFFGGFYRLEFLRLLCFIIF